MNKLSIIIPAYNEEERIGRTLESYGLFFKNLKKNKILDFEILVVLNACTDNSIIISNNIRKKIKEIKIMNFKQGGKGFAILEGFKDALKRKNDLIGFVDADMATSPDAFYNLVKTIKNYDGVIASRGLKNSLVKTSLIRKITNRGFNFLVKSILLLPYNDTQCGAKIFKREALKKTIFGIGSTKWAFDIDLLYQLRKKGFEIVETPTIWEDKEGSKINLIRVPFQMFSAVIRIRLINSPFNFIVRAYNKLPEDVKIHNL